MATEPISGHIRLTLPFMVKHSAVFARAFKRRFVDGKPIAFSFNVADRCPNNCDCYWRAQARVKELTDEQVIDFFKQKRAEGYVLADLVGGEPYVRPELLEKIAGIIPFNLLVTSGTTPLRHLRNTSQFVSIDGATAETHDHIRRSKGLYDRIVKNITQAKRGSIGPILLHVVLNHLNYPEIPKILRTWSDNGLVEGVLISTMTPIKGASDDNLRLSQLERMRIVRELHWLKRTYGDFMIMTDTMIDFLHPNHTRLLSPEVCSTAQGLESYDAAGQRIKQCILSEEAYCPECGCVVTLMLKGPSKREAFKMIKYFHSLLGK